MAKNGTTIVLVLFGVCAYFLVRKGKRMVNNFEIEHAVLNFNEQTNFDPKDTADLMAMAQQLCSEATVLPAEHQPHVSKVLQAAEELRVEVQKAKPSRERLKTSANRLLALAKVVVPIAETVNEIIRVIG